MTNNELNNIVPTEGSATTFPSNSDGFCIEVVNTANNASCKITVYPENTLFDILDACSDIALSSNDASRCVFEYNGETTSESGRTLKKMGVVAGSKILINPQGKVA